MTQPRSAPDAVVLGARQSKITRTFVIEFMAQAKKKKTNRWVAKVKTDSTHPEKGLFTKSASTIARELASTKVSPKGPSSGMRMLTYFINRGGRGLSAARRAELEEAKILLSKRIKNAKKSSARRKAA
jgi:tRNA(adenine34) deaminase